MKTIMLCLNKLGIGGLETAVLNQTIQLIKRNFRVIILADDGIYKENFEKEGAICVNFKYVVENKIDEKQVEKVMNIIEKYKIEQVHIHQFDCIGPVYTACILKNVPYVAYLHCGIMNVYDWFEECFPCYKEMFSLYFHNAAKIVAIRESAKQENIKKYNVNENKYIVKKNSIDFNEFKVERNSIPKKIEKFLIISRLAKEKEKSINNAISLFKEYHKKNNSATLTIVGDGEIKDNIKIQIQDLQDSVKMLGARNDIPQIMSEHDVIIALDRCILEAITMKKLAIISGYETLKELITITNVEKASDENFGGENLKDCTIDELIEQLLNLNENEIKVIVEQNYEFAYRNLNIEKNVYVLEDTSNLNIQFDVKNTMKNIIKLQNIYDEQVNYTDKIYKECKKAEQWYQGQIEARDKQIDELIKERQRVKAKLEKFHLDKVYKIYKKIKSFFKKESVV